jgi:hypothetical protein
MPEYVVSARRLDGEAIPPFIVIAPDVGSVHRIARRTWLVIESVRDYVPAEGQAKPVVLRFGPPLSAEGFEREYEQWERQQQEGQQQEGRQQRANPKDDLTEGERTLFTLTYYLGRGLLRWW